MLMNSLPIELEDLILNYKSQIEHTEKTLNLQKEYKEKNYECGCCQIQKNQTINKIFMNCERCIKPIGKCCKYCDREDPDLCNICYYEIIIIGQIQEMINVPILLDEQLDKIDTYLNLIEEPEIYLDAICSYLDNLCNQVENIGGIDIMNENGEREIIPLNIDLILDLIIETYIDMVEDNL